MDGDRLLQAKGQQLLARRALVGGDAELAEPFRRRALRDAVPEPEGLPPHPHAVPTASLQRMIHVPGELFSVNPATARGVPGLFARNERVVCVFDGPRGPFVMVLVGATIVGSMATVWHGVVNPPRPGSVRQWRYGPPDVRLRQGDEMGRFLLGSTVVMLFPPGPLHFDPAWQPAGAIRMGQPMARAA